MPIRPATLSKTKRHLLTKTHRIISYSIDKKKMQHVDERRRLRQEFPQLLSDLESDWYLLLDRRRKHRRCHSPGRRILQTERLEGNEFLE